MSNEYPSYGHDPLKKSDDGQNLNSYDSNSSQGGYAQPSNGGQPQYPGYGQNPYAQPPAQAQTGYQVPQGYPQSGGYMGEPSQGKKYADMSLIFAIIGFFIAPIIFAVLGLVFANKAEKLGHPATAGKIISWIDIALIPIGIFLIIFFLALIGTDTSSIYY